MLNACQCLLFHQAHFSNDTFHVNGSILQNWLNIKSVYDYFVHLYLQVRFKKKLWCAQELIIPSF